MSENEHVWVHNPHTSLVQRGNCFCGAVRFFPMSQATAAIAQAKEQNEKHGKEGYHDKADRVPIEKTNQKEEKTMVAQINASELKPETRAKLGIEKISKEPELPPVPPRPDTTGKTLRQKMMASHDYYEANKPAILQYLDTLGEKEMLKRWDITQGTWGSPNLSGLRNRWRPEKYGPYISQSKRRKIAETPAPLSPVAKGKKPKQVKEVPPASEKPENAALPGTDSGKDEAGEKPAALLEEIKIFLQPCNINLPKFPEFNPKWKKDVQLRWLETYEKLTGK